MRDNRSQIMSLAEQRIKLLYDDAYTRALKISEVRNALDAATNSNFTFKANPRAEKELRKILEELGLKIDKLINSGEKTLAKDGVKMAESNILAKVAASDKPLAERLIQAAAKTNRIDQAMGMELANKKRGGVTLSDRIWKTVSTSKKELEIIIQNNIIEGKGAVVASREVRQYLNDPNKLYRRVKDKKTGEYKLSKAAQQYHPGQGKYRSSYMNARRLTVTEMNMATQAAESAAYASNPLIAGYEIRLSNNHTVKDPNKPGKVHPLHDICDELQGNYPATFKFTGWHPHCRCTMIPILISAEERRKLAQARAEGKSYQPKGIITDVPANYKQWVAANQQRIADAKTLPFFLQDNGQMTKDGYEIGNFTESASGEAVEMMVSDNSQQPTQQQGYVVIEKKYKTAAEVKDTMQKINDALIQKGEDAWFQNGVGDLQLEKSPVKNGSTIRSTGEIFLKKERLEWVKSALGKIGNGKSADISFEEADGMATYWHEITHNRSKVKWFGTLNKTERQTMEMMNEFVARKTLPEFYNALGVKDMPHKEFVEYRKSTAYDYKVKSFELVIDRLGLDKNAAIESAKKGLFETNSYKHQQATAVRALIDGGIYGIKKTNGKAPNLNELKRIVNICGGATSDRDVLALPDLLKQMGLL